MKIFVKCMNCGYTLYTQRHEIFALMLDGNFKACSECKHLLDLASVLICGRKRGDYCDACEFRFQCFSSEPVEADIKGLDN